MNYVKMIGYAFALALIAGVLHFTYTAGYDKSERVWLDKYTTELGKLNDQLIASQRKERAAVEKQEQIEADLLAKQKEQAANANAIINDLRAGNVRLRDQFKIKQCASVSGTTGSAGGSDAASTGGLSEADVRFLVSEASRADQLAEQLIAAQQVITNDRVVCQ
ncbi:Rz lysis protein [Acinetobacter phage vB_AbaP_Alexa]|nr:Rz lysis protein [Acinetobacter phage vB_AbaP_Alexa]